MHNPCALIPVYNHEAAVPAVVRSLLEHGLPCLLVDDGSSPACAAVLAQLASLDNVSLITLPTNQGKGGAVQVGFREADLDGTWVPYRPVGCERCNGSGYKGRVGIYQVMPITEAIQQIILRDGSALEIAAQARSEGVKSLRESGLDKVRQGITSLEEVLAVTNL